jgi:hypothetical protein
MWELLMGFLFARATGLSRYLRYGLALFGLGIVIAGLIYTCVVLNAANERSHAPHVHTRSTH